MSGDVLGMIVATIIVVVLMSASYVARYMVDKSERVIGNAAEKPKSSDNRGYSRHHADEYDYPEDGPPETYVKVIQPLLANNLGRKIDG